MSGIYVGLSSGNVGIGTGGINSLGAKLNVTGDMSAGFLIGQVSFFTMSTAPTGWLKCNGAAISRTTYAKLFAVTGTTYGVGNGSTTFNLPDLRGEFIRGFDDGRAIDSGRTFGTSQTDAMQGHYHNIVIRVNAGAGPYNDQVPGAADGGTPTNGTAMRGPITDGGNGVPRTAAETRPRNLALLACIKF
jgi:microcystin-dependent protein